MNLRHHLCMLASMRARCVGATPVTFYGFEHAVLQHGTEFEPPDPFAPIPVEHAWLVHPDDPLKVIDPTWHVDVLGRRHFETLGTPSAYLGITFASEFYHKFVIDTGYFGVFGNGDFNAINNLYLHGFPQRALQPLQTGVE